MFPIISAEQIAAITESMEVKQRIDRCGMSTRALASGCALSESQREEAIETYVDVGMAMAPLPPIFNLGKLGKITALFSKGAKVSDEAALAAKTSARLETQIGPKIERQMSGRGWTRDMVEDLIENPSRTVATRDTRWLSNGVERNDAPATAYLNSRGGYVVRNDETGDIVQVSNLNDPNWKSPW
ncbi:colicin E5-related ribonuclease [Agromyces larvae]|uniref:Colicin E5 ribonuclease domain-containing protein n=1 Tax=Agromyces larvae TaxID=2929802 RepID=A0ABY4CAB2_9MICO|nr:colicin E5-related ribonuclease [Agromyces larvae]UOE45625.1 hypothetical protein MTO99_07720 [Agromyces larvae]